MCMFIFPQVSRYSLTYFRYIVCLASALDASMSLYELFMFEVNHLWYFTLGRFSYALMLSYGFATIKVSDVGTKIKSTEHVIPRASTVFINSIRMVSLSLYIGVTLFESLQCSMMDSLSRIVHLCFIVGCIAYEAIIWKDLLMCRLRARLTGSVG